MNIVGGALFKEEELLLIKRAGARKVWPGLWEIPGGRVEKGETPAHALNREFQEEAGLADRLVKKYCTIRYDYQGTPATEDDYIVATDRFEVTLSEEHTAFRWGYEADY